MPLPDRFSPRLLSRRLAGRLRLARGRCPSCGSHGSQHAHCRTCLAYEGPFPVSETTLLRWAWRFQGEFRTQRGARRTAAFGPVRLSESAR